MSSPIKPGSSSTTPSKTDALPEQTQYQKISETLTDQAREWNWTTPFIQSISKACGQFRLRIDDEANQGFLEVFQGILAETDKEVRAILQAKKAKIETSLRNLQNNELSMRNSNGRGLS